MASCDSCGAPFDWAKDPRGKSIPVDQGERTDGNVAVKEVAPGKLHVRYLRKSGPAADAAVGERRTTSHFATCPDAEAWRERGRG